MNEVFSYISVTESLKACRLSRRLREYVAAHWDSRLSTQILEIETLKAVGYESFNKKIPLLYDGGFYSPFVKVLDQIILVEKIFLSKYHLEEIRTIIKPKTSMLSLI